MAEIKLCINRKQSSPNMTLLDKARTTKTTVLNFSKTWHESVPPPLFFMTPVTNYVLYSTLLCKTIARAPGVHKTYIPTKLGEGRNRIDPINVIKHISCPLRGPKITNHRWRTCITSNNFPGKRSKI